MSENKEKRMIADTGYEIKHSIHIGNYEILVGVNMDQPEGDFYLVANYAEKGLLGEYSLGAASSDYLEIMQEFTKRINNQIEKIKERINEADYQAKPITANECHPHDYSQSIEGKVVAISASVMRPEYRRGDMQLVLVERGNGTRANPSGHAVYCRHLNDGSFTRFERYDVLGEPKELPEWAKGRLAEIIAEKEAKNQPNPEQSEPEKVGNYTIIDSIKVGNTRFVLGENPKAPSPYATWKQIAVDSGYNFGNYFTTRTAADIDLRNRAIREREHNTPEGAYKAKKRNEAR